MSSSPSSRRNRSSDVSNRRHRTDDSDHHYEEKDDGSEFNTRGHGPPKIEGMVSLKVDNITQRTGVNLLKKVFSKFGDLGDIYVPRYPDTFASRGFAFVRYYRKRDAEEAMRAMNGERLDGRILSIQMARYARPNSKPDKHVSSKRTHHYSSDLRRNGDSGSRSSYRRSGYSDRFSRRRRSRSRSPSRSRDKRKSERHGRSRSGSKERSKKRSSRSRYRSKSKSRSRSRSRSKSRSRSRSHSTSSSKSNEDVKTDDKCENNAELDDETILNTNNNKSDVESEKSVSLDNNTEERSHSNGR